MRQTTVVTVSVMDRREEVNVATSADGEEARDYGPEHARTEAWLDEHPEFFQVQLLNTAAKNAAVYNY